MYRAVSDVRQQLRKISEGRIKVVPRKELSSDCRNDIVVMIDFRIRLHNSTMLSHEKIPGSSIRAIGLKNQSATQWEVEDLQLRFGDPQGDWRDSPKVQKACQKTVRDAGSSLSDMIDGTGYIGYGDSGNPPIHLKAQNPDASLLKVTKDIVEFSNQLTEVFSESPDRVKF